MADTKSQFKGRLPIGEKPEKSGFIGGGEDVQCTDCAGRKEQYISPKSDETGFIGRRCDEGNVCDTTSERLSDGTSEPLGRQRTQEQEPERSDSNVSNSDNRLYEWSNKEVQTGRNATYGSSAREWKWSTKSILGGVADGIPAGMDGNLDFIINHYWEDEPDIPRVATGIEHRVDRLKCLGNAVVPQQFYPIFRAISEITEQTKGERRWRDEHNQDMNIIHATLWMMEYI